ncbi:MAG: ribonuclease HII [Myxococcales bacterium]|nr:ribonuclease HII [Myxococcales bacterium]
MEQSRRTKALARHRELLDIERALWTHGLVVAGIDEVGAGPLAGPVVAACVVLDPNQVDELVGVDDSKQLSEKQRNQFAGLIKGVATAAALGEASVEEIDEINIRVASLLAMERALNAVLSINVSPDHLLVDARAVPNTQICQSEIVRGDSRSLSIAAASVVAKVERDRYMVELSKKYPGYGFEKHKGYGTKEHLKALEQLGPCPAHRQSYAPVRHAAGLHCPESSP